MPASFAVSQAKRCDEFRWMFGATLYLKIAVINEIV